MSQDGQPDTAPDPNHALAARMKENGFSEGRLATAAGVDIKTVGRWVRGESLPQAVNARATADALGCDPLNRPGKCGGSRPWKRGWSRAEGTVAGEADHA